MEALSFFLVRKIAQHIGHDYFRFEGHTTVLAVNPVEGDGKEIDLEIMMREWICEWLGI